MRFLIHGLPFDINMHLKDNYMEEALKMRNLLQEFLKKHDGVRYPSILGLREHIFTGRYALNMK